MTDITLVGLMSTWREGKLAENAWRSLNDSRLDGVLIGEGPAGPKPDGWEDLPETVLPPANHFKGEWTTDAAKLNAFLPLIRSTHTGPIWAVWLAGDELLVNGHLLRDILQRVQWEDERLGRHLLDPDNGPAFSVPLTQVEHDGSLGRVLSRCVRVDLIRRYVVSSHVIELVNGATIQHGNRPLLATEEPQYKAMAEADGQEAMAEIALRQFVPTLLAGEPYTIHRPHLRHPARQAVRMHHQEAAELRRLGLPTG